MESIKSCGCPLMLLAHVNQIVPFWGLTELSGDKCLYILWLLCHGLFHSFRYRSQWRHLNRYRRWCPRRHSIGQSENKSTKYFKLSGNTLLHKYSCKEELN